MNELNAVPLPERMRPDSLDRFIGQAHLLGENGVLRKWIMQKRMASLVLWGPPGTGKTTLAKLITKAVEARFIELSAVLSGVKELRDAFAVATDEKRYYGADTVLFVDEIHRFSKAQQDVLLPAIEQGTILFIGSTTENPRICLTPALQSRLQVFELLSLTHTELKVGLLRALTDQDHGLGLPQDALSDDALMLLIDASGGDLRKAMLALSWSADTALAVEGNRIEEKHVLCVLQQAGYVDESLRYDMLSAFGKSLRGSDSDAALYWFFRMIQAGVDPRIPVRRLIVHASEDVGLASPTALTQATSAMYALESVGMPEARIPIAQAIIFVCEAPKSNRVILAVDQAQQAARQFAHEPIPIAIRDKTFYRMGDEAMSYRYPHDFPQHYVKQQYLPDVLRDAIFYRPSQQGTEGKIIPHKLRETRSEIDT